MSVTADSTRSVGCPDHSQRQLGGTGRKPPSSPGRRESPPLTPERGTLVAPVGPCCGLQRAGLWEGRARTPRSELFTYLYVFAPDSEASSQALPPSAHGQWDRPCLQPYHRLAPVSLLSDEHTVLDPQSRMVGGVLCLHLSGWLATARRLEPGG